ncbi:hypothetical protein KDA_64670 [Dictyobacter alpinus]|uniref:Chlor_Arch_YYY domain-containing protein n=1 Tax=Dictyobacter alpinus TaxID=2014873 RepID=A0A402BHY4_9CHLR|nr:DUF2298 domain-containing protein [Dictyobacter alpinus]GCE30983.1 hypothetical protein KDA_64670 [Dictyobacter alpinus]
MLELFQMWALVEFLGILFLPLTVTVFRNIPDRGWAWSKALAIFVLAFCVWWPLMVIQALPFSQLFIFVMLLLLLVLNVIGFLRTRQTIEHILRANGRYIAVVEAVFLLMMLLLGWLRSFKPDIYSYEMFMDGGFLASIMRSEHFPPQDMWYAGYSINYYYYAHYIVALLAKLLGQIPSVAFNTGISMLYGLTAVSLFGVTSNLIAWSHRVRKQREAHEANVEVHEKPIYATKNALLVGTPFAALTVALGLLLGNLASTIQWFHDRSVGGGYDWFNPTRIIPRTINEFPAFSFLLSDFHAHVLSLAFTILGIGMALNLLLEQDGQGIFVFGRGWRLPLTLGTTSLLLGGLFVMNGWDLPTYMGLAIVCLGLQQWLRHEKRWSWSLLLNIISAALALIALAVLLFLPFHLNFISPSQGIGIVALNERSPLRDELLIYSLFAFLFLTLLFTNIGTRVLAARHNSTTEQVTGIENKEAALDEIAGNHPIDEEISIEDPKPAADEEQQERYLSWPFIGIMTGLGFMAIGLACQLFSPANTTLFLTLGITITAVVVLLQHTDDRAHAFTILLGAVAIALVAGCEIVFLRDVFVDNNPRMNTVFKFYFQAWILLSIACGAGLYYILENFRRMEVFAATRRYLVTGGKVLWGLVLLLFLLAGSLYPLFAPYYRFVSVDPTTHQTGLFRTNSLDGLNYLKYDDALPGDYDAIRWLNSHVSGSPVIVEAVGDDYTGYARVSALTGLPTLMGWIGHEIQWRIQWINRSPDNAAEFDSRKADVTQIYSDPDPKRVLATMNRYHAQYIYVGASERATYGNANLDRFASFMQVVYKSPTVTIYKLKS